MNGLLRLGARLANPAVIAVVVLLVLGFGFTYVSGLNPDQRDELLFQTQRYLPMAMFLTLWAGWRSFSACWATSWAR
jgi:hypothetical protein